MIESAIGVERNFTNYIYIYLVYLIFFLFVFLFLLIGKLAVVIVDVMYNSVYVLNVCIYACIYLIYFPADIYCKN